MKKMLFANSCELCKLMEGNIITRFYYSDNIMTVVDCKICKVPLIVYYKHTTTPILEDKVAMIAKAQEIGRKKYGENKYQLRFTMKRIPDHYHFHVEPFGSSYNQRTFESPID